MHKIDISVLKCINFDDVNVIEMYVIMCELLYHRKSMSQNIIPSNPLQQQGTEDFLGHNADLLMI